MSNDMGASILALQARIAADAQTLSLPPVAPGVGQSDTASNGSPGFTAGFKQVIESVNEQDRVAADKMAAVDSGRSDDLVGAMLASQEASLSFSMLMQARNKIVGAMDDLIKLQL